MVSAKERGTRAGCSTLRPCESITDRDASCGFVDAPPSIFTPAMECTITSTVLGKRKVSNHVGVIFLASSPEPTASEHDDVVPVKRPYQCTYPGCSKAYTKPSRLQEHQRSHTGEVGRRSEPSDLFSSPLQRPFVCDTCQKSYLRETHLQAHVRSHQPESARPLKCQFQDCQRRFWTSQHLRVHHDWHNGAKPFAVRDITRCFCSSSNPVVVL